MHHPELVVFLDALTELQRFLLLTAVSLIENLLPFLPGELAVAWAVILVGGARLQPFTAIFALTVGAWLGFMAYYESARVCRDSAAWQRLVSRVPAPRQARVGRWLETHGLWVVGVHRFIPGMRTAIALVAGLLHLSRARVGVVALATIALWHCILVVAGQRVLLNGWDVSPWLGAHPV